jgi:hypothetical protein
MDLKRIQRKASTKTKNNVFGGQIEDKCHLGQINAITGLDMP